MLVGMVTSPHFQKWIKGCIDAKSFSEIHIFPSDRYKSVPSFFSSIHGQTKVIIHNSGFGGNVIGYYVSYVADALFAHSWRAYLLAKHLIRIRPGVIHFHEMQKGSYIFNYIFDFPRIHGKSIKIISTWGSDLEIYSRLSDPAYKSSLSFSHEKLTSVCLSWADIITAERSTELERARELGYLGQFISPIYITVGLDKVDMESIPSKCSGRKQIIIKGYQHDAGRALNALTAIRNLGEDLKQVPIRVFSASESIRIEIQLMRNVGFDIRELKPMPHHRMLEEFAHSRMYLGISISDGLSTSMVEAMSQGCFPIQSENSAAPRFIQTFTSGVIVNPWDITGIQNAVLLAMREDSLIDNAQIINKAKILTKEYTAARLLV
jgi:glycosyltransferase involved in cell wall biosynthesis